MEQLIEDSRKIYDEYKKYIDIQQVIYTWFDIGENINTAMWDPDYRIKLLESLPDLDDIISILKDIIRDVTTKDNIILYRGAKRKDDIIYLSNFSSFTPSLFEASSYGDHIRKVIIPEGTHCFYLDVVYEEEDFGSGQDEVLLFGGKLTYIGDDFIDEIKVRIYEYQE